MARLTHYWVHSTELLYAFPPLPGPAQTPNSSISLTAHIKAAVEVEELEPKDPAMVATIKSMNDRGIKTLYGRWLIDGAPRVLLFDTSTGYGWLDEWKGDLWSVAGIPSPPGDSETNEAIVFGYIVAWFLGEVRTMMDAIPYNASTMGWNANVFPSMSTTRKSAPSSSNFTNGSPALLSLYARNVAST